MVASNAEVVLRRLAEALDQRLTLGSGRVGLKAELCSDLEENVGVDVALTQRGQSRISSGSTWRRLPFSATAPKRSPMARKAPPASISASWRESPTPMSFPPAALTCSTRR